MFHQPPIHRKPRIHDDLFKQDPLRPSISLAEGMNDIQVAISFSYLTHKVSLTRTDIPIGVLHMPDDFCRFWWNTLRGAKQRVAFLDVDAAQFAGPVINVTEQDAVNVLQAIKVVGRRKEWQVAYGDFG